jgi:hypothetical protein
MKATMTLEKRNKTVKKNKTFKEQAKRRKQ